MTVTAADLAEFVNASPADPLLPGLLADAEELISEYLGTAGIARCPTRTYDLAIKTLASELFARRNAPGGISQWGPDGQPVRLARDPLVSVRSLLLPYRSLGAVG